MQGGKIEANQGCNCERHMRSCSGFKKRSEGVLRSSWPITNSMTLYCSKRLPVLACVQRSQMFWFNWMKTNIQFSMQIWNPATLKTLWPRRSSKRRSFEICYSKIRLKEEKINFTRAVIKFKIGGNWEKRRIKDIIFATVDGCPY